MEEITEEAAGLVARVAALDIGKASLVCCVRVPHEDKPGARRQQVRTYETTTRSLLELRDWLTCQGVSLCVMEATSIYWKPPFYLLEDAVECWVVNARDVKNVPGRPKTDLLTELPAAVGRVGGHGRVWVASVARRDHWRRCATGLVPSCGTAGRVA
jgi:transposase